MSIWLILTPLFAWLTFGTMGYYLLSRPVARIWADMQITTAKRPYDPATWVGRFFAVQTRTMGAIAMIVPPFATIMALLVAVGVVSPARN